MLWRWRDRSSVALVNIPTGQFLGRAWLTKRLRRILKLSVLPIFLNPRFRSVARGNLVVLLSLVAAFFLSDFPHNRPTLLLALPALTATAGTADTIRCMQKRWSFYHGGVVLCVYMDLMAVSMILFFLLYPYAFWMSTAH